MIGATSAPRTPLARAPHPVEQETVALYATDLARRGRAPATITRRLVSIAVYHRAAGYASPTEHGVVRAVVSGLRRQFGVAQQQKTALEIDSLCSVLAQIPGDVRGLRDRALLLIGWAAALRRELAALVASDLRFELGGLIIELRRSKTDQEACRRGRCGSVWRRGGNVSGARRARTARRSRR